ncbi:UdgX family uracil-DNA binding protein [Mycobacterium sp. GA-2829]|uniref:UdgX family uracil-DNA binding protein n=1 Tax=Mycobacterium sp. GA-2829 TaxID=1772283 RepID=UPI000740137F|nr:UdgX family uracil-DNA binding protein [Mycobacterium sp. GA-2829]KUI40384.1 uracil-DNA glycosylase [Mycobacterium sp. GA-2829]
MATKVPGAQDFVPDSHDVAVLADAVQACRGCELYRDATQGVFGQGSTDATVMLIGEQPGDQEDVAGAPFVGPAGRLLDKALVAAGIDRDTVYVTNAVKHFKFTLPERGKRRIHKTPSRTEVVACRPWLLAELDAVQPDIVVLLGATAAKALLGNDFRITAHRGEVLGLPPDDLGIDPAVVATVHPSSVLRGPRENRQEAFDALTEDLRVAARLMADSQAPQRHSRRSRPK